MNLEINTVTNEYDDYDLDLNEYDVTVTPQMALAVQRLTAAVGGAGGKTVPSEVSAYTSHGEEVPWKLNVKWGWNDDDGCIVDASQVLSALDGLALELAELRSYNSGGTEVTVVDPENAGSDYDCTPIAFEE